MDRKKAQELIGKYVDGTSTPEEKAQLLTHFNTYFDKTEQTLSPKALQALKEATLKGILDEVDIPQTRRKFRISKGYYAAAAILIVTLATTLYLYRSNLIVHQEILPGYNQATLTLANGETISLDSSQSGIIVQDESIKYSNGNPVKNVMLSGEGGKEGKGAETSLPNSLTLTTPKGGQYQIILSDGTKVWLNAASTLKYPSRFSGDRREVSLEGEAYFEIKEDKTKPFKVVSQKQEVLVLGTSFNISSYEGDESVRTTLVTGAVKVAQAGSKLSISPFGGGSDGNSDGRGRQAVKLSPGEQSILAGSDLTKVNVDINRETAWKDNKFSFSNKPFTQIMRELGRWYNLEVVYEGNVPTNTYFGFAYRTDQLSFVLDLLQGSNINYRLEGRKLIISTLKKEVGH